MRILITGGGTGGHLFPGIALAEEFQRRSRSHRLLFVGSKKGLEERVLPSLGYELKTISGVAMLGTRPLQKLLGVLALLSGVVQALVIVLRFGPHLVIGTGGYASASVILAAWALGKETAICEQNSIPGFTNRILAKAVKKVFIAFEESCRFFPKEKTVLTGNPVRRSVREKASLTKGDAERVCFLVLGGSQGARSINRAMVEGLATLAPWRDRLEVIHQTGFSDIAWVEEGYAQAQFRATVSAFITDMAEVYQRADLVIARAGALTVSEVLVWGKPAVYIPYPYAAYNHQEMNARAVMEHGAARIMLDKDLTGERLGMMLIELLQHPEELRRMGEKARALARPDAAKSVVDHYCREEGVPGGEPLDERAEIPTR
jgi:UDP-N-acetylglucosamine--N-acetylmuramyl-(pentapeptide) pyrophosphoryl-undecaprenol N-acetylglucosamine transferase